eukprot:CAMPEP_0174887626 /NCGR_PEP_ID=MMETSP0167-20121228/2866_1 /TAXON_ID=38298 /ORGANISM="Rhodella maculata, Strain CCMP736" /LENGTH=65 /DNA_ID=CAMNT_0016124181 /DNA_START=50 /DNA_END=247 /DNA_ORIENTATION=-
MSAPPPSGPPATTGDKGSNPVEKIVADVKKFAADPPKWFIPTVATIAAIVVAVIIVAKKEDEDED